MAELGTDAAGLPRACLAAASRLMRGRAMATGKDTVLLIEADPARRAQLSTALAAAGMRVVAVSCIAEVERWPAGDVVVTDSERFTPWWRRVGATHVVVMADTPQEGADACQRGASAWVPRTCSPDALVGAIRDLPWNVSGMAR